MIVELRLEYRRQQCEAVLVKRDDGSKYVRFESRPGHGHPSLDEAQLVDLVRRLRELR